MIIKQSDLLERVLFKPVGYYFLVSLTVANAVYFMNKSDNPSSYYFYPIVGGIVLYAYLIGKMEQRRFFFKINNQVSDNNNVSLKYEPYFVVGALVLYLFSYYFPIIAYNSLILGIYEMTRNIYHTPIIGWVFGLIGVFFLLSMIFKAVNTTGKLINKLAGNSPPPPPTNHFQDYQNENDTEFTNFEEVDDDEEQKLD